MPRVIIFERGAVRRRRRALRASGVADGPCDLCKLEISLRPRRQGRAPDRTKSSSGLCPSDQSIGSDAINRVTKRPSEALPIMPQRSAALTALAAAAVAARRAGAYQTLYFNQSLTHDGTDPRTFSERYLLDATHAGGRPGGEINRVAAPLPATPWPISAGPSSPSRRVGEPDVRRRRLDEAHMVTWIVRGVAAPPRLEVGLVAARYDVRAPRLRSPRDATSARYDLHAWGRRAIRPPRLTSPRDTPRRQRHRAAGPRELQDGPDPFLHGQRGPHRRLLVGQRLHDGLFSAKVGGRRARPRGKCCLPLGTRRGDAAGATWIVRGNESPQRKPGTDVRLSPRNSHVAAAAPPRPVRGISAQRVPR